VRSEIDQLLVFCRVVKLGSFTKAAKELYLTQPAISAQVAKLEKRLKVKLIDRLGRRAYPTEAGKLLYSYAEQVERLCAILTEAELAVAEMDGELTGRIVIGSSPTIAIYVLPWILGHFKKEHPKVDISLAVGQTREVIEGMANNLYDFALLEGPRRIPGLIYEHLMDDELYLSVAPDHPWVERGDEGISIKELDQVPMICHRQGSGAQTAIEREFQRHGIKINSSMVVENNEVVKRMVEAGLGISILSRLVIQQELERGSLVKVPIRDAVFIRRFRLATRKGKHLSRSVRAFLMLLEEEIARKYPSTNGYEQESKMLLPFGSCLGLRSVGTSGETEQNGGHHNGYRDEGEQLLSGIEVDGGDPEDSAKQVED
jgi:DNA-binding transcriptional LysR family regulator